MIVPKASCHAGEGHKTQHRRRLSRSRASHRNRTGQGDLRLFELVPRGKPVADAKMKAPFEPAWLPVDRREFPNQVCWQLPIEILSFLEGSKRRRSLLIRREAELRRSFNHDQLSCRRE